MNYTKVSLRRQYRIHGVPVELSIDGTVYPQSGQPELRAIEQTEGVELGNEIVVTTTRPVATVMRQSLIALGLELADFEFNALITMNGMQRRINSVEPLPTPQGELDGEVMLFLEAMA